MQAIAKTPWAITPDGLELVLGIAQRKISDYEAASNASDDRKNSGNISVSDGIAILNVTGTIFPRATFFTNISGGTTVENLSKNFSDAIEDKSVKAIVLNIDSPGGQVTGVHEFAEKIYKSRGTKPIIAYVSALGASAAYWIATAADSISVDATAMVGSIGVVTAWTDDTKAKEADGYRDYQVVSSKSPNKRTDPKTPRGRELLLKKLDDIANIFIADVARNRRVGVETVESDFGQGGIIIASEAIKLGMADELNSLEGVLKKLSLSQIGDSSMSSEKSENLIEAAEEGDLFSSEKLENKSPPPPAKAIALDEAKANLLASNAQLYSAIKQEGLQAGISQERERIKSIDAISESVDNKKMIEAAKYENPCSAKELAFEIVKAESENGRKFSADYAADAKELLDVKASADTGTQNNQNTSDIQAMIAGAIGVKRNG